jgi:hypothetical protein
MRRVAALENQADASWRGRIFFELLDVAVFDLLHEGFALKEVALEVGGELAGDDEELVVGNFGERDGAAGGNEMRTLLEDEACVPRNHKKSERSRGRESEGLLTSMGTNAECVVPYFMTIAVAVWVWWIISENKYPSKLHIC